MEGLNNWKSKTLILGAIIGLVSGLGAAYMLVRRAEDNRTTPQLSSGDSIKLGLGVLGLMRLVAEMGDDQ
ncbi:MAG: hypothetical protein GYA17_21390 [Chloroflexi bacterium]|nr:hypothetical protein [Anaerolineaceae bacterium]NMB90925.1 hypothetical protein [Chloroflexota bacterium]